MKAIFATLLLITVLSFNVANAQQARQFGDFAIHYNALNSSLISPQVAKTYGITRSDSRALINISVLKHNGNSASSAVKAVVTASGRNLIGQTHTIEMREITEGDDAVYYIGELSVRNMETLDFAIAVTPVGQDKPFRFNFKQQFYTE